MKKQKTLNIPNEIKKELADLNYTRAMYLQGVPYEIRITDRKYKKVIKRLDKIATLFKDEFQQYARL